MSDPTQLEVTLVSQGAGHTAVRVELPDAPSKRGAEPTSAEAGHRLRFRAGTLRTQVLAVIQTGGGWTADEVASILDETVLATRPRLSELKRAGLIRATGERRRNASGMSAAVWVAV